MKTKRVIVVGAGVRARDFVAAVANQHAASAQLVGLCDVSRQRMQYMNDSLQREWGSAPVAMATADEFEALVQAQGADLVVVTTVDALHHEYIGRALRLGCEVVTEKPLTIDAERCRLLLDLAQRHPGRVRVAFNYRWQPHRTEIKRLLAAGTIGRVKSVNLEYLLDTDHGADYFRRWHAHRDQSGGLLVHKGTHHFDLVNWWLDAIPEQVFALGDLAYYGRENAIARGDGRFTAYERYTDSSTDGDPFRFSLRDGGLLEGLYLKAERESGYIRDRNVFRPDIDVKDVMSVVARYRTGQQLVYSLVCFSPREGMRVTFNGDRGRLEYYEFVPAPVRGRQERVYTPPPESREHFIRIFPHFASDYTATVDVGPGSHLGADPLMMEQLFARTPPADPFGRIAGVEQGAASILVGIGANEAIARGQPVRLSGLASLRPSALRLSELD